MAQRLDMTMGERFNRERFGCFVWASDVNQA